MEDPGTSRAAGGGASDAAAAALAELAQWSGRTRRMVYGPFVVLGVALIVPAYWGAQLAQWELVGVAWSAVSAVAGAVPLLAGVALGKQVCESVLRARLPEVARELAHRHGVSEHEVEELAAIFLA